MKINDKFEVVRDRDGWVLLESYTGTGKDGSPKVLQRKTYHANLRQVIDKVIDLVDCVRGLAEMFEYKEQEAA